ncbi:MULTISPECIES: YkgJ family cysteine cluster protein [unclassified Campylobacter]|uniref:YkgJ family cysteine cluster protein n=1 Tax=unclassified Campylobacter TaxID=2593542 RepID=UPI0022E9D853|nr:MULTISPECIES: YkgJ family cysteine cluster protein [unclassified Campylobacter]MDA3062243.1 YkgJ family cysteine cluster protein [Campylobacter sp. JMF_14 EL1]MDA3073638.1 YkgJ family cysteine cluster protein [Campylobacter sp. JMF_10 EL2]
MSFNCSKCGECCRHIANIPQLSEFDRGDGVCKYLRGHECDIYDTRPEICNVEKMYEKHFSNLYSRDEFYKLNEEACEMLQNKNLKNLQI